MVGRDGPRRTAEGRCLPHGQGLALVLRRAAATKRPAWLPTHVGGRSRAAAPAPRADGGCNRGPPRGAAPKARGPLHEVGAKIARLACPARPVALTDVQGVAALRLLLLLLRPPTTARAAAAAAWPAAAAAAIGEATAAAAAAAVRRAAAARAWTPAASACVKRSRDRRRDDTEVAVAETDAASRLTASPAIAAAAAAAEPAAAAASAAPPAHGDRGRRGMVGRKQPSRACDS